MDEGGFTLCLTHDVDRVRKTYQRLTHFIRTGDPYHLTSTLGKRNPYWNFDKITALEEKYGVRSTFFFLNEEHKIPARPSDVKLYCGRYDIHELEVAELIKRLDAGGWEIGLHGSYNSYLDESLLRRQKRELEEVLGGAVEGVRQHYLNLEVPATWRIQEKAGFKYDASFGSRDKVGFRDEKYLPFQPLKNHFIAIPTAIMDSALFSQAPTVDGAWAICSRLIDKAEKERGVLTILWHNHVFDDREFPGWSGIYEKIIVECKRRKAIIATCRDVARNIYSPRT